MPWDTMLPETAKALSAPLTKLVKVLADGCGKLYEPTGIRRKAAAEADALLIQEVAQVGASDIRRRAAQRVLDVEERRQENIEDIAHKAAALLPDTVSETPVDPDWATRFFNECQDIRAEELRTVWARLLAGELASPGSFSPRTLAVLKNLTASEAQLFNTLCKHSFRAFDWKVVPLATAADAKFWDTLGLNYVSLQRLVDAGLIHYQSLGVSTSNFNKLLFRGTDSSLVVECPDPARARLSMGRVHVTVAGQELSTICEWSVPDQRLDDVGQRLAKELGALGTVARVVITGESGIDINYNESFKYSPNP